MRRVRVGDERAVERQHEVFERLNTTNFWALAVQLGPASFWNGSRRRSIPGVVQLAAKFWFKAIIESMESALLESADAQGTQRFHARDSVRATLDRADHASRAGARYVGSGAEEGL